MNAPESRYEIRERTIYDVWDKLADTAVNVLTHRVHAEEELQRLQQRERYERGSTVPPQARSDAQTPPA